MAKIKSCFFVFIILFFFSVSFSFSQNKKYIVYFGSKSNSSFTLDHPEKFLSSKSIERRRKQNIIIESRDLPIDSAYIDSIEVKGASVLYVSKWLNAAIISATDSQMNAINQYSFVINKNAITKRIKINQGNFFYSLLQHHIIHVNYGNSENQIAMLGADFMHQDGFHGEGKLIAVFDAGFKNASSLNIFTNLFSENRVIATYDFVDHETNVYDNDPHGTNVLSVIAGYKEGSLIGTAYKSDFILLRTEDANSENFVEETNWLRAAEYADSAGADIISSSLGYSTFDNVSENHIYADMNGHTTIITKAAEMAVSVGMIVVSSAGNEGQTSWKYITAPADGNSVLSVGAVDKNEQYVFFSSVGPTSDGRIKPDVVAQGSNTMVGFPDNTIGPASGTSFSCPLIAGFAAGIWQAYPELTALEVTDAIKKSGSNYKSPDNTIGYGIPDYKRVKDYIRNPSIYLNPEFTVFPNPLSEGNLFFVSIPDYMGEMANIKLYDVLGHLVSEEEVYISSIVKNNTTISASSLSKGLYVVVVSFRGKSFFKKIIRN